MTQSPRIKQGQWVELIHVSEASPLYGKKCYVVKVFEARTSFGIELCATIRIRHKKVGRRVTVFIKNLRVVDAPGDEDESLFD